MKQDKKRTIMTIYIDKERGILTERNPFENSMKWDSPAVIRALNKKLKNGKKS